MDDGQMGGEEGRRKDGWVRERTEEGMSGYMDRQ